MRVGLPPIVGPRPRVLILGSFPSEQSLASGRYYANPRNQFWRLLGAVFGFDAYAPYDARIAAATEHGVALWDVLHSCRRAGSLDARIDRKTAVVNDIGALLADDPGIERIVVNGTAAREMFERHVRVGVPTVRVPSSSPAATMAFDAKLAQWRVLA
jgi:hypoxanthine-DNA glycosylase